MNKPTLSPEDQEKLDNVASTEDQKLPDEEDSTSGGDWILAVNGERPVRDKLTGYIE
jgi:hypothetical protein